ncbi:hypothetical protein IW150_001632 [Coemansia sp. RSA 2607]|nr:hypothetical protein IW150_001632 [Coemansia sp. RSA 2607]
MSKESRQPSPKRRKVDPPSAEKTYDGLPERVDYLWLSKKHPSLHAHLKTTSRGTTLNFQDAAAVRTLNRALLLEYYDLDVYLPATSLCPTVANRLNYLLWIKNNIIGEIAGNEELLGLDVGTGASCIYPLLGVRVLGARFVATDINRESVEVAQQNVAKNTLTDRITVVLNEQRSVTLPLDHPEMLGKSFSFSMCNPPFYANEQEQETLRQQKRTQPRQQTVAKPDELYTEGGEQQFVLSMADESKAWSERVHWYSTMVGRKQTLAELRARVRGLGARQVKEGSLLQGVTTRWVLAWSFMEKSCFALAIDEDGVEKAKEWVECRMRELGVEVCQQDGSVLRCSASEVTWTRRARRQKDKNESLEASAAASTDRPPNVLVFTVSVDADSAADAGSAKQEVRLRFVSGSAGPSSLASLYNHLLRQLRQS